MEEKPPIDSDESADWGYHWWWNSASRNRAVRDVKDALAEEGDGDPLGGIGIDMDHSFGVIDTSDSDLEVVAGPDSEQDEPLALPRDETLVEAEAAADGPAEEEVPEVIQDDSLHLDADGPQDADVDESQGESVVVVERGPGLIEHLGTYDASTDGSEDSSGSESEKEWRESDSEWVPEGGDVTENDGVEIISDEIIPHGPGEGEEVTIIEPPGWWRRAGRLEQDRGGAWIRKGKLIRYTY